MQHCKVREIDKKIWNTLTCSNNSSIKNFFVNIGFLTLSGETCRIKFSSGGNFCPISTFSDEKFYPFSIFQYFVSSLCKQVFTRSSRVCGWTKIKNFFLVLTKNLVFTQNFYPSQFFQTLDLGKSFLRKKCFFTYFSCYIFDSSGKCGHFCPTNLTDKALQLLYCILLRN